MTYFYVSPLRIYFRYSDPLKLPHKLSAQKFAAGTTSCSTFVSQSPDLKAFIHMVGLPFFTFAAKSFVS